MVKMMKNVKSFFAGMMTMVLIIVVTATAMGASNLTDLKNVRVGGVTIVIDGQKLNPTDVNGNTVQPMIYNGTTYLPVRAVASAVGKAVYWDGPSYTVYLGNMNGKLEHPTVMMTDLPSIADTPKSTTDLVDNYGNRYGSAVYNASYYQEYEYLLNMKYSHFKGTLYIPEGESWSREVFLTVKGDGHTLYTSPAMGKISSPVSFDVNVTGYNDIEIFWSGAAGTNGTGTIFGDLFLRCCLADAGFYQ